MSRFIGKKLPRKLKLYDYVWMGTTQCRLEIESVLFGWKIFNFKQLQMHPHNRFVHPEKIVTFFQLHFKTECLSFCQFKFVPWKQSTTKTKALESDACARSILSTTAWGVTFFQVQVKIKGEEKSNFECLWKKGMMPSEHTHTQPHKSKAKDPTADKHDKEIIRVHLLNWNKAGSHWCPMAKKPQFSIENPLSTLKSNLDTLWSMKKKKKKKHSNNSWPMNEGRKNEWMQKVWLCHHCVQRSKATSNIHTHTHTTIKTSSSLRSAKRGCEIHRKECLCRMWVDGKQCVGVGGIQVYKIARVHVQLNSEIVKTKHDTKDYPHIVVGMWIMKNKIDRANHLKCEKPALN